MIWLYSALQLPKLLYTVTVYQNTITQSDDPAARTSVALELSNVTTVSCLPPQKQKPSSNLEGKGTMEESRKPCKNACRWCSDPVKSHQRNNPSRVLRCKTKVRRWKYAAISRSAHYECLQSQRWWKDREQSYPVALVLKYHTPRKKRAGLECVDCRRHRVHCICNEQNR